MPPLQSIVDVSIVFSTNLETTTTSWVHIHSDFLFWILRLEELGFRKWAEESMEFMLQLKHVAAFQNSQISLCEAFWTRCRCDLEEMLSTTILLFKWHVYFAEMGFVFRPSEAFSAVWDKISEAALESGLPAVSPLWGTESFLTRSNDTFVLIVLIRHQRHLICKPEENAHDMILCNCDVSMLLDVSCSSPWKQRLPSRRC